MEQKTEELERRVKDLEKRLEVFEYLFNEHISDPELDDDEEEEDLDDDDGIDEEDEPDDVAEDTRLGLKKGRKIQ